MAFPNEVEHALNKLSTKQVRGLMLLVFSDPPITQVEISAKIGVTDRTFTKWVCHDDDFISARNVLCAYWARNIFSEAVRAWRRMVENDNWPAVAKALEYGFADVADTIKSNTGD